ncbi:unnamed protein product [Triticum turgidum subsp. durum]|uniref:L-gulonolactone oxidase n=1 Tax=Triticum turgidum subsp. durum TaxID=4567 RepID=A0A9R0XX72_TRITD|nr:unnamed protein product [Triticum turgidum subsp. durum]
MASTLKIGSISHHSAGLEAASSESRCYQPVRDRRWRFKGERKPTWVSWEVMTRPKYLGGLGFRNLELFNLALLARQSWRVLQDPSSLSSRILKASYYPDRSLLNAEIGSRPFQIWRAILEGRDILKQGLIRRIGNGQTTSIWDHNWIPKESSLRPIVSLVQDPPERVAELMLPAMAAWNEQLVRFVFLPTDAEAILRIPAIHEGVFQSPMQTSSFVNSYISELDQIANTETKPVMGIQHQVGPRQWLLSPSGVAKINADGAVARNMRGGAVAAVCRDHTGAYLGSSAVVFRDTRDPTVLETFACREALSLAEDLHVQNLMVASDCQGVVNDIVHGTGDSMHVERISNSGEQLLKNAKGDALFPAALVSLGLLGVISKVTLALEPRFKRSVTYDYRDDSTFQDDFANHAARHEFADIAWYPSQHQAVYRLDDRAPLNATGDGVNDFIGFRSTLIAVSQGVRALETALEGSRNVKGKCAMATAEIAAKRLIGNGLRRKDGQPFTGYPVVGFQGKMQTSGSCARPPASSPLTACAWDPRFKGLFFYESTAIFSPARFRSFVLDVKKLRDLNPDGMCGVDVYNGLLVRFVRRSEAWLGQPEDSVVVDFNYYRAADPSAARLSQDVWEEVEQLAFVKHGARPHWAKNRMVAFRGVQGKYPGWARFAAAKRQLDPRGLFDSPWSEDVVGGKELSKDDGCALDGRCVCSEDRHCSPGQGYYCGTGLVFSEARVCRYSASQLV